MLFKCLWWWYCMVYPIAPLHQSKLGKYTTLKPALSLYVLSQVARWIIQLLTSERILFFRVNSNAHGLRVIQGTPIQNQTPTIQANPTILQLVKVSSYVCPLSQCHCAPVQLPYSKFASEYPSLSAGTGWQAMASQSLASSNMITAIFRPLI